MSGPAEGPLLDAVRALWPDGVLRRYDAGAPAPADPATDLALVPGARSGLVVPRGTPAAAARAMSRFSSATSVPEVARRLAGAWAVRLSRGAVLRSRLVVTGDTRSSFAAHLAELLGQPVSFSVSVGSDRVNRKPVLEVFDAVGRTLAFVKLGDTPSARSDVTAEGVHLRRVQGVTWSRLRVPRVLHETIWRDVVVLVVSALPTAPARPWGRGGPPTAAMNELAAAFAGARVPLAEVPWLARQQRLAARLPDADARRRLGGCLDALTARSGDRPVAVGAWHGDWTPWNMSWHDGRVHLWDWERFETGVPAGLDRYHYAVNDHTARRGTSVETVLAGLEAVAPDREDPDGTVAPAYLAAVTGRYLSLAALPRGQAVAARGRCTLEALERRLGLA